MKKQLVLATTALGLVLGCAAQNPSVEPENPPAADSEQALKGLTPLIVRKQGSFFVGGETKASQALSGSPAGPVGMGGESNRGDITVNQMYVQYQLPVSRAHTPVVFVNGCCLTAKSWETTPDGRMGWSEYFLRRNRGVYLADQVARGRSGFDATPINEVKLGVRPPSDLPNVLQASHQLAWGLFRLGPTFRTAFPDGQFPVEAADELFKQMVPDLNQALPTDPAPTPSNLAKLADKIGGAVLVGTSQSGFFPQQAAFLNPRAVKGMITIETLCPPVTPEQVAVLAKIPMLIVWGDHLADVPEFAPMALGSFQSCQAVVDQVKAAGGDAMTLSLPDRGIRGNSHMPMVDRNNIQVADVVLKWIDQHVERGRRK